MPNCFTLTPKGKTEPETLAKVDDGVCALFGVEPHPSKYFAGWYDDLGLAFAMGKTPAEMVARCDELLPKATHLLDIEDIQVKRKIAQYFDDNYTVNAWAEIGFRR